MHFIALEGVGSQCGCSEKWGRTETMLCLPASCQDICTAQHHFSLFRTILALVAPSRSRFFIKLMTWVITVSTSVPPISFLSSLTSGSSPVVCACALSSFLPPSLSSSLLLHYVTCLMCSTISHSHCLSEAWILRCSNSPLWSALDGQGP